MSGLKSLYVHDEVIEKIDLLKEAFSFVEESECYLGSGFLELWRTLALD